MCFYWYSENQGCLNGGGQLRDEKNILSKELFEKVQKSYDSVIMKNPTDNEFLSKFYDKNPNGNHETELLENIKKKIHTSYRQIEKSSASLTIKW
jgi:iron only hydrogenase large subunit-like protein